MLSDDRYIHRVVDEMMGLLGERVQQQNDAIAVISIMMSAILIADTPSAANAKESLNAIVGHISGEIDAYHPVTKRRNA